VGLLFGRVGMARPGWQFRKKVGAKWEAPHSYFNAAHKQQTKKITQKKKGWVKEKRTTDERAKHRIQKKSNKKKLKQKARRKCQKRAKQKSKREERITEATNQPRSRNNSG